MKKGESLEKLENTLRKREIEAEDAKTRGQKSVYGNLLLEINLIKAKIRKCHMGSKTI